MNGTLVGRIAIVTFVMVVIRPAAAGAQSPGTIVIAHGASAEWNVHVEKAAADAAAAMDAPVAVSYLMGPAAAERPFQAAVKDLVEAGAELIVVVPLLVSSHSGHYEQIRWLAGATDSLAPAMRHHLEMSGIVRPDAAIPIRVAPGLDDAPQLAAILAERARALAEDPAEQALFLMGHGPNSAEDHAAWMENLRRVADRVGKLAGFQIVRVGLVRDDAPDPVREEAVRSIRETIQLQHAATGRPVVVVPILISQGRISGEKFPADLAGLPIVYDGTTILPHPMIAEWIVEASGMAFDADD